MVNTYDRYIANIAIKCNKCTISWYVNDNKVSHVNEEINTELI